MTQREYDVVIVGAGPAGSSAGWFLAKAGVNVLLLDKAEFPRDKTCGDGLTPRALAVLEQMGLLPQVEAAGWRAREVQIFSPDGTVTSAQVGAGIGRTDYSVIIQRRILDYLILQRAMEQGAHVVGGMQAETLEPDSSGITVRGKRGAEQAAVRARVAIVATGASTPLLLRAGILPRQPRTMLAARAYFEDVPQEARGVRFHFDGVPLPGYGWVFPLPDRTANVGAGFLPTRGGSSLTARAALERWLDTPPLRRLLQNARQRETIRSYPLRVDFLTAPTCADRVLLVGEAAGLVNPLTGEGIDYALESGRIAAQHLVAMLTADGLTRNGLQGYDATLRTHFGPMFQFCERVRDWFLPHPVLMNLLIRWANRRPDLKSALVGVALGGQTNVPQLTPWLLSRALLAPSRQVH